MKRYLKICGPVVLLVLVALLTLTGCGSNAVPADTSSGDYVATALATTEVGGNLGAGIGWAVAALVLGLVAGVGGYLLTKRSEKDRGNVLIAIAAFVLTAALVFGVPAAKASYVVIDPGTVGVVVEQGRALNEPLMEGPHWISPFTQKVRIYSIRPFTFSLVTDGADGETPQTKGSEQYRTFYQKFTTSDGVEGKAAYLIQASLDPQKAPQFYRDFGTLENGIVQKIKTPAIPLVRDVLRGLTATQVVTTIDTYNETVATDLRKSAEDGGFIFIDFAFSRPNMGAWGVERDLTATTAQQALTEANKVAIAKATGDANIATAAATNQININAAVTQAEIAKTKAQGDADAAKIQADATAYTTITVAEAQAKANTVVAQTLSAMLLEYQKILKWTGVPPTYMGGNGDGTMFTVPLP